MLTVYNKFKKKKLLFSYLSFATIMFLIPVAITIFYFYPQNIRNIERAAVESTNTIVAQISERLSTQMETILAYPSSFLKNANINSAMMSSENAYNNYIFMKEMNNIVGSNSFIEKTIYYNKKTGRFYGNHGDAYATNEFNMPKSTFIYDEWEHEEMLLELDSLSEVKLRPMGKITTSLGVNYNALTILMPMPYGSADPAGVLLVIVQQEKLFSKFMSTRTWEYSNIILMDDYDIIAYANETDYLEDFTIEKIKAIENKSNVIVLSGNEYYAGMQESTVGGLKYLVITSKEKVLSETKKLTKSLLGIFLATLILFLVTVTFFFRLNYRPLKFLQRKILQEIPQEDGSYDEVQYISKAFDYLKKENKDLIEQVVLGKNISLEFFLTKLVNGQFDNSEEIWKKAKECGICLRKLIICFSIYISDRNVIAALSSLNQLVNSIQGQSDQISCHVLKGQQHEDFILLLTYDKEDVAERFYAGIYQMDDNINIGIGSEETLDEVKKSYMLSLAALEYAIVTPGSNVITYNEIEYQNQDKLKEVFATLSFMESAILQKNEKRLYEAMCNTMDLLKNKVVRIMLQKTIYINIYNVLVKGLREEGEDIEFIYAVTGKKLNLIEAERILKLMYQRLVDQYRCENTQLDINEVLEYIDNHYMEQGLSLNVLGDVFHMSYSNFSHYFKKNAGNNFTTHLENLRIAKVKEFLKVDNISIEYIASQVGYNSANSLSRAFKKSEGRTPGEYRRSVEGK